MASIGEDIASVIEELGTKITVYTYSTQETFLERMDPEEQVNPNSPVSTEYFQKVSLFWNTHVVNGSLITYEDHVPKERFLVATVRPTFFEGKIINHDAVLFRCNAVAQLKRKTESRDDNMELQVSWETVNSGEYVLFTGKGIGTIDRITSNSVDSRNSADFIMGDRIVYISKDVDIQERDRCIIKDNYDDASGEIYEIRIIENHKLPGLKICQVLEDTRE